MGKSVYEAAQEERVRAKLKQEWETQETCGIKFDEGKLRYDLLPPDSLQEIAEILTIGAAKYGDRNWEQGMSWSRVFAAAMRHLWAWWRGEGIDKEDGKSHLAHAACCVMFLQAYALRQRGNDDRAVLLPPYQSK